MYVEGETFYYILEKNLFNALKERKGQGRGAKTIYSELLEFVFKGGPGNVLIHKYIFLFCKRYEVK